MNEVIERNNEILKTLIDKYNIDKSVKELVDLESVFIFVEYYKNEDNTKSNDLYRVILYANIKYAVENGNLVKLAKAKRISLYTLGKKMINKLTQEEVESTILELTLIGKLVKQLKLINKIEKEEFDINDIIKALDN